MVVLREVFGARLEAFEQNKRRRLTGEAAGELLGMSGRHLRRLCVRYEEDGIEGLREGRIGKVSPRRARGARALAQCMGDALLRCPQIHRPRAAEGT
jgi:hypothetical protein